VQHRELIATAFRVGGLLLGIPSSVAFAFFGFGAASLHFLSPRLTPGGKSGDQLIDLLVSGARILARLFEFFGGGVEWLLAVLSVVSFGCLVFAVVLHFTGRGVHASRGVARTMGILLVILPLLVSFIGVMALRKHPFKEGKPKMPRVEDGKSMALAIMALKIGERCGTTGHGSPEMEILSR
jgi:hypothetical protein